MKNKKLLWGILLFLIVGAIAYPWYQLQVRANDNVRQQAEILRKQELQELDRSFANVYGANIKVNNLIMPENVKIYLVSWSDDKYNHVSMNINGAWVEISRQELPKSVNSENK